MSGIFNEILNQKSLVQKSKELIREVYLMNNLPWVVGYSGGKDSTATTQIIIETLIEMKRNGDKLNKHVYVISSNTLVENPMIINTISNTLNGINNLGKIMNLPISAHVVKPEFNDTFWVNIIGRGYPSPNQTFRWCTDRMKIDPANKFIKNVIDEYGEVIMILGVREGESLTRDGVIKKYSVKGKELMKHSTMQNAYVFAPIKMFSVDDVWDYLLSNESPWGSDNSELYRLYSDSSSECPLVIDEKTKNDYGSCGNSRFGCWVCTVVNEDKSLTGFIQSGENWLRPLLEYRNWLYNIRDEYSARMKRRSNGSIYFSKVQSTENSIIIPQKGDREKNVIFKINEKWIDSFNEEWTVIESPNAEYEARKILANLRIDLESSENPRIIIKNMKDEYQQLGLGPFTFETRKNMLKKLLETQKNLLQDYELITTEELLEIRKLWYKEGDTEDSVNKIYKEVYGIEFYLYNDDIKLFNDKEKEYLVELCSNNNFDFRLYNQLLQTAKENFGYFNRNNIIKDIKSILNKESVMINQSGELNEDK